MDSFLRQKTKKTGFSAALMGGILVAVLIVVAGIWMILSFPPAEKENEDLLAGAFIEGTPEFEEYAKEIIINTDTDRLMQSSNRFGSVTMHVGGEVYNKGDKELSLIEVRVGIIDSKNEVMKEKKVLLVPNSISETLGSGSRIDVSVAIGGFNQDDDRANARWKVTAIKFVE